MYRKWFPSVFKQKFKLISIHIKLIFILTLQGNLALEKSRRKCPYSWFPEAGWEDAIRLAEEFPDKFSSLIDDIERHEKVWKKVKFLIFFL